MTTYPAPMCVDCKNLHRGNDEAFTCNAYPDAIPFEILSSQHDHRFPFPGDRGIRFEPVDEAAAARWRNGIRG